MRVKTGILRYPGVAVLALGMALSPLAFGAKDMHAKKQQRSEMWGKKNFDQISTLLNLNADQKAKAKQIFLNAWEQTKPLLPELRENRMAIRSAITTAKPEQFNSQIEKFSSKEGSLISQMITIRTKALEQFYNVLTPEQRQKAVDLYDLVAGNMHFRWGLAPESPGPSPSAE